MKYCIGCGREIAASKKFCGVCGTDQMRHIEPATQVEAPSSSSASKPSPWADPAGEYDAQQSSQEPKRRRNVAGIAITLLIVFLVAGGAMAVFAWQGRLFASAQNIPTDLISQAASIAAAQASAIPTAVAPAPAVPTLGQLPVACPVAEFGESTYELIKEDRADTTLACVVGRPNSGMGVWFDYTIMSPADWDSASQNYAAQGALPVTLGLGETAAYSLETQGIDGPETSYFVYVRGVSVSIAATMHAVEVAVQAIPAQ